jgi:hypothetical protein
VTVPKKGRQRRLHKALLRYHDPAGWPLIREALIAMGKESLIGSSPNQLVPAENRTERASKWSKATSTNAGGNKAVAKGKAAPKSAKAEEGQMAMTRFSSNQFEDRKSAGEDSAKASRSANGATKSTTKNKSANTGAKKPLGAKAKFGTKASQAKSQKAQKPA